MKKVDPMAEQDARPVEGILIGSGVGFMLWALIAMVATLA
jgi:hypothetical protein